MCVKIFFLTCNEFGVTKNSFEWQMALSKERK